MSDLKYCVHEEGGYIRFLGLNEDQRSFFRNVVDEGGLPVFRSIHINHVHVAPDGREGQLTVRTPTSSKFDLESFLDELKLLGQHENVVKVEWEGTKNSGFCTERDLF